MSHLDTSSSHRAKHDPIAGVPQTWGTMHFGETNPSSNFWKHVKEWWQ